MDNKGYSFFLKGWSAYKGKTFMRVPNVSAERLWPAVEPLSDNDKKSLIAILTMAKHPATSALKKIYKTWLRHRTSKI